MRTRGLLSLRGPSLALPAVLLFLLLASLYTFSIGLRASRSASITGDEPFYLVTTQSILKDGNLDLRRQYATHSYRSFFDHPDDLWTQSVPLPDGRVVSPHEPGLSVLVIPGFVLGGLLGVQVELLLIAAATFALAFVLAASATGRPRLAWVVTAVVGLAAPGFVYATEIYPEMPAALCLVLALLLLRMRPGIGRAVALALVMTAFAWLGMKYVPLGLVVAVAYLWRGKWDERAVFVAACAVSAVLYTWAHLAWFGALTPYNTNAVYQGAATTAVLESHLAFEERVYRLWGLFIDRRFGIGRWAPVFLAVLPALPLVVRGAKDGAVAVALVVVQLLMATFVSITMMGWWFPGRMLIVVYPLFALVLTVALAHLPRLAWYVAGAAALYSLLVTGLLVAAAGRGEVTIAVNPFDMTSPAFRVLGPLFPQYTWWGRDTLILNAAWLAVGAIGLVAALWSAGGAQLRTRVLLSASTRVSGSFNMRRIR